MVTSIAEAISSSLIQLLIWFPEGHTQIQSSRVKSVPVRLFAGMGGTLGSSPKGL